MSNRALRKLQRNTHLPGVDLIENKDGNDSENEVPDDIDQISQSNKKSVNLFALLGTEEDEKDNENEDEVDDPSITEMVPTSQAGSGAKKKRKKKKKKSKDTNLHSELQAKEDEDEIDASIREVNKLLEQTGVNINQSDASGSAADANLTFIFKSLLSVEHRNLNPDNEMKRIFGSRIVQAERRQRQRGRLRQKATWLCSPRDSWPPMAKFGLSMSLVESGGSEQEFTFEHNHAYQQAQFQFYDAVESLNPQNIADIIKVYPYHVDALLQLAEICRMGDDTQTAAELIERALYSMEMNFHPLFSLTKGSCRLSYRRAENRAFYLALFRHLIIVGQKGCYATALEFCKLLLSLDPDSDPLGVLLMIDFYALRARDFSFLIRLYQEWNPHRNLSQLPNFSFSVALAMFHDAQQQGSDDTKQADDMLQTALLMFPRVLPELLHKCNVNPDNKVASHPYFGPNSHYSQSTALKQLVALYVGRCFSCWKEPEVLVWLEKNVHVVMTLVDKKDPRIDDFEKKRKSRYQGTPKNVLRHILIAEVKDATAALTPDMANTAVLSYDPLPPENSICGYQRPQRRRRADEGGALSMFFRSLLPNFNPQEPAEEGAAGGTARGNLQQEVGALMQAMRDLLQNIRPVDHPVENGEDQDVEEEEWD